MIKVAPSLLSANFACLKDDIEKTNALEKAYNMAKEIKINEQEFNSLFFT
jgi:hypothetical protein